ncbi:hypothetical protein [Frankia nepalensis]|uniref:DUF5642 domain-containing protein n=1 Tax=Frankia nepalensis TaxID=1836974 RepID=A0A937ULW2_9ACTN|nr:hypothetical protein [Frankia nepalensis]MBL7626443.1 hypothetical protein [Frankia nepalensis]
MSVGAGAALALTLALTGCSSDGDGDGDTPPSTGTGAPAIDTPASDLRAEDFVYLQGPETDEFTVSDEAKTVDPNDSDNNPWVEIADCGGQEAAPPIGAASGPGLSSPDGETVVQSYAQIVTPEQHDNHVKLLEDVDVDSCVQELFADGDTSGEWKVRDVPALPGTMARTSMSYTESSGGATATSYFDIIWVGEGQVEAELLVLSRAEPDEQLIGDATASLVKKLKDQ